MRSITPEQLYIALEGSKIGMDVALFIRDDGNLGLRDRDGRVVGHVDMETRQVVRSR